MRAHSRRVALIALLLAWGNLPLAHGAYETPSDYMLKVSTDWVTPHVPWATPYALGEPKVLFLCAKTIAPREVVELNERLPMDFALVTTYGGDSLGTEDGSEDTHTAFIAEMRPEAKKRELLGKLGGNYDAIVLGQVRLSALPKECLDALLAKVRAGAGLVLAYDGGFPEDVKSDLQPLGGATEVLRGIPLRDLPGLSRDLDLGKLLRLYSLGRGRVAVLDYGNFSRIVGYFGYYMAQYALTPWFDLTPRYPGREKLWAQPTIDDATATQYEYALMLVARTLLWTIPSRAPRVTLAEEPHDLALRQDALPKALSFAVQSAGARQVEARYTFRRPEGDVLSSGKVRAALQAGLTHIAIPVPQLPSGKTYLEVQVVSPAGVEAWWATALTIDADARVEAVVLDQASCAVGDEVGVEVRLSQAVPTATARLRLLDVHDREILRQSLGKAGAPVLRARFAVPPTTGTLLRLEADLLAPDGRTLSSARARLRVAQSVARRADFPVVLWSQDMGGYLQALLNRRLRDLGVGAVIAGQGESDFHDLAYTDLCSVPGLGGPPGFRWGVGDSAVNDAYLRDTRQQAASLRDFDPLAWNMGDELDMARDGFDSGADNAWMRRFRAYLRDKYGAIDKLNAAWDRHYATFDDVQVPTVEEARKTGQVHPLVERWLFLQQCWSRFCADTAAAAHEVDPHPPVGFEGSGSDYPTSWTDYRQVGHAVGLWAPYSHCTCGTVSECLFQSFVPRDVLSGNWWGGYDSQRHTPLLRFLLWDQIVHGHNSLWMYRADGVEGILGADLTPSHHLREVLPDLRRITGGIGPLVAHSTWTPDPVAVYWSEASYVAREIEGGRDIHWGGVHGVFHGLLQAGFAPRFIDKVDLTSLDPKRVRALVLVDAQCLSDEECRDLERYVRAGGCLIAAVPPASCTAIGLPRAEPPLDDLFGIRRGPDVAKGMVKLSFTSVKIDAPFLGVPIRFCNPVIDSPRDTTCVAGPTVREGASAISQGRGGEPIFVTHAVGEGRTILLNFTYDGLFDALGNWTPLGEECEVRRNQVWKDGGRFWRGILDALHVAPGAQVVGADGLPVVGVRRGLYTNGAAQVVVLACISTLADTQARLALPARSHVVDLLTDRYLGYVDSVPLDLSAGKGFAFSLLPAKPAAPKLDVPVKVTMGKAFTIAATASGRQGGATLLRFDTTGPDGQPCPWFSGKTSTASLRLIAAWNDPPGRYRVEVADIASGTHAIGTFEIAPRP